MQFTAEQYGAIDVARHGEDACIVAGPGSGKTTVLVERYRQLVERGIDVSRILAITFTEKAAANMLRKLGEAFAGDPAMLRKLNGAYVSTIHGFCARLLREHSAEAGVDPRFTVWDEQPATLAEAEELRETLDQCFAENHAGMSRLLDATGEANLEALLPDVYEAMRSAGVSPLDLARVTPPPVPSFEAVLASIGRYVKGFSGSLSPAQKQARDTAQEWLTRLRAATDRRERIRLLTEKGLSWRVSNAIKAERETIQNLIRDFTGALLDDEFATERELLIHILHQFDLAYRARKRKQSALDFNDLEWFSVRLLRENDAVRRQINQHFQQVMTDEFQDTSPQQATLMELLRAPGCFYAVGDLNQSIYSFRHANPAIFSGYREQVQARGEHYQELTQNWRSRAPILQLTQTVLRDAEGITKRPLVPSRELPGRSDPSIEVIVVASPDENGAAIEASWIANRILDLHTRLRIGEESRPAAFRDFAIIVRNSKTFAPILEAFERAGLPFSLNRRNGFFETREARDLLHLLRVIDNKEDELSAFAVLRSEFAGVSDEAIARLKLKGLPLLGRADWNALGLNTADQAKIERFTNAMAQWRTAAQSVAADRLLLRALDEMGVVWDPRSPAGSNIEKFLGIVRAQGVQPIRKLVDFLEAMRSADPKEIDSPVDETLDAVQLMTAHGAKGLEFPVVILPAMDTGVQEEVPGLSFTPEWGLGARWSLAPGEKPTCGLVQAANEDHVDRLNTEEANRLLYVAMTRAEEHLILSWSEDKKTSKWVRAVRESLELKEVSIGEEMQLREYRDPDGNPFCVNVLRTATMPTARETVAGSANETAPLRVKPLADSAGYDRNLPATALAMFARCPRQFYLGRLVGWNHDLLGGRASSNGHAVSSGAADLGTEVHRLLASDDADSTDWTARRLADTFERSALGKRAAKASVREREWDFLFAFEELLISGKIDLWFEEGRGLTLVDYKTDDVDRLGAEQRAVDYATQMQVYALALERAVGRKPKQAWLHFLRPDVAVPVPLDRAAVDLRAMAQTLVDAENRGSFPLVPGTHCRRCDFYRNICPAKLRGLADSP